MESLCWCGHTKDWHDLKEGRSSDGSVNVVTAGYCGDALEVLKTFPDETISTIITSPPYWNLRDYSVEGQLGLEKTFQEYIEKLCLIFNEVKRVLKKDGTCWINLGDTYSGSMNGSNDHRTEKSKNFSSRKQYGDKYSGQKAGKTNLKDKCLCMIPERFAIRMCDNGWILRSDIIWHKPNPMPESVTDRPTKSHEYIFLFSKNPKYYYDYKAIMEEAVTNENRPDGIVRDREYDYDSKQKVLRGRKRVFGSKNQQGTFRGDVGNSFIDNGYRNKRSVWTIPTHPYREAHFATFPENLIIPMIKAGCPEKEGIVLDPFAGAMTTPLVALKLNRKFIAIELNKDYCVMGKARIERELGTLFNERIDITKLGEEDELE